MWTRALLLVAVLAASAGPAWGSGALLTRDIPVSGQDVRGRVEAAVAQMKSRLVGQGCDRIGVAYWSRSVPLKRLHVEVWCRDGEEDGSLAAIPMEERR